MKKAILIIALFASTIAKAQLPADTAGTDVNTLLDLIGATDKKPPVYITSTFKSSRIINGHSVELVKPKHLDFRLSHRFGSVRDGIDGFFGLDNASTRIALEYGINDFVMVGLGRSGRFGKSVDGFVKAKVLRQREHGMPITATVLLASAINTQKSIIDNYRFDSRLSYTFQMLLASKISNRLSVQAMPTLVHRNLVPNATYPNDLLAVGLGGRFKLSNRFTLTGEYYYRILTPEYREIDPYYNSFSIGVDIDTGGHIFALHFTNSQAQIENGFVGETGYNWLKSDFCFGFNITRQFYLGKKDKNPGW